MSDSGEKETKIPKQYLRFREKHSTIQKLEKIFELMEELGISFDVCGQRTFVKDTDQEKKYGNIYLEDLERNDGVLDFPPSCEYKVIAQNLEYIKYQEEESIKWEIKRKEEKKQKELEEEEKRKKAKEKMILEKKNRDMAELERIKQEYGL